MAARKRLALLIPALVLTFGCSEAPKQAAKEPETKAPEKAPEPVSGRTAFHQMFVAARNWAPDVQPLQLVSLPIDGITPADGKFGAWRCTFASQSKGKTKVFTYAVVEGPGNLHKGVFYEPNEERFAGTRGQMQPFVVQAFRTDSPEALQTALDKGGAAEFVKKNPTVPMVFLLEWTPRFPNPAWRVIWGESVSTSQYSVFVDVTTGAYLAKVR